MNFITHSWKAKLVLSKDEQMSERPLFKQCPNCQQFSPEESSACLQCGYDFESEQKPEESRKAGGLEGLSPHLPENSEGKRPKKKSGCLRKLGLGALIVVGLFIVLGVIGSFLPDDLYDSSTSVQPASTSIPTFTSTPMGSTAADSEGHSNTQTQPTLPTTPPTHSPPTRTPVPAPILTIDREANIRHGPGTNYPVIGTASPGRTFPITAKSPDGEWWKISYNGQAGWVWGQLVTPTNETFVQIAATLPTPIPTPEPTKTLRPRPTQTPRVTLDRTQRANLWVHIANDEYYMVVYADPAFDIEEFTLELFVDGKRYCNTSKIYDDEGPRKLSCEVEQRLHTSVQRVSAQTPSGDLKCERHVESDSNSSVFACVFR